MKCFLFIDNFYFYNIIPSHFFLFLCSHILCLKSSRLYRKCNAWSSSYYAFLSIILLLNKPEPAGQNSQSSLSTIRYIFSSRQMHEKFKYFNSFESFMRPYCHIIRPHSVLLLHGEFFGDQCRSWGCMVWSPIPCPDTPLELF